MRIFRLTRTLILGGLLAMSLTLNVATVAFSSVALFMSNAYTVVTVAASVVGGLQRDVDKKTNRIPDRPFTHPQKPRHRALGMALL